jgi:hypothetical protein
MSLGICRTTPLCKYNIDLHHAHHFHLYNDPFTYITISFVAPINLTITIIASLVTPHHTHLPSPRYHYLPPSLRIFFFEQVSVKDQPHSPIGTSAAVALFVVGDMATGQSPICDNVSDIGALGVELLAHVADPAVSC